jgi:hypothetical protein
MGTPGIKGIDHLCYIADIIQEGIGERVAEAATNEAAMAVICAAIPEAGHDSLIAFNNVPDTLVSDIEKYLERQGGCKFVTTGRCPLVNFLVDKAVEDY